jgi:hypothetical protein
MFNISRRCRDIVNRAWEIGITSGHEFTSTPDQSSRRAFSDYALAASTCRKDKEPRQESEKD